MISRLDPPNCGCVDCQVGEYSRPLNKATEDDLLLVALGRLDNASGFEIKLAGKVVNP